MKIRYLPKVFSKSELDGTYAQLGPSAAETITYNGDGTINAVTEALTGAVTTYAYNGDGTIHTESRLQNGVTTTRTFSYTSGNLVGIA